jgi:hypothetical protein
VRQERVSDSGREVAPGVAVAAALGVAVAAALDLTGGEPPLPPGLPKRPRVR